MRSEMATATGLGMLVLAVVLAVALGLGVEVSRALWQALPAAMAAGVVGAVLVRLDRSAA